MNPRFVSGFFALVAVALALPAHAVNDFNSSRSNRERGRLAVSPPASSPSDEAPAAQQAQDFNATRSNRDKGAMVAPPPVSSSGDAPVPMQAQDFNTTRSNKDKRGMKTTHVHGDPHVDQISVDEPGMPASSSSKRVLPTVNKRVTAADGPDQDCDGMAEESKTSETCPAATPVRAGAKGGKTGHVTILK